MWRKKPIAAFDPVAFEQLSHEEKLKVLTDFIAQLDEAIKSAREPRERPQKAGDRLRDTK